MTTPTLAMLSLTLVSLAASIFALVVALRTSDRSLSKRLSALSTSLADQVATLDDHAVQIRALRARINMGKLRAERKAAEESGADSGNGTAPLSPQGESADDRWARETNLAIATGRIRPFGR